MANIAKGQNQPCDFHTRGKTYASARHWSPHSRINVSRDGPFSFSGVNNTKASTMDGDKRRLFLERMKANPFFKRNNRNQDPSNGNLNKSTGVEILTDDEVGTVSSEDPHGHMSLFLHHQHEQQAKHYQQQQQSSQRPKFDLKGPVYGYRSLSNGSRIVADKSSSLFANVEDEPPLMMSSIDGVTTQVKRSSIETDGVVN